MRSCGRPATGPGRLGRRISRRDRLGVIRYMRCFRLAKEVKADLLVVGNVGLSTRSDKWLGSVPGKRLAQGEDRRAARPHHRLRHR